MTIVFSANGRIDAVDKVIRDFDDMMKAKKGTHKPLILIQPAVLIIQDFHHHRHQYSYYNVCGEQNGKCSMETGR